MRSSNAHHADVVEVSRRAGDFCSGKVTTVMDTPEAFKDYGDNITESGRLLRPCIVSG